MADHDGRGAPSGREGGRRSSGGNRGRRTDSRRDPRDRDQRGASRGDRSRGSRPEPSRKPRGGSDDPGSRRREAPPEGENFGKVAKGSVHGPEVDRDAVITELDHSVRRELSSLPGTLAEKVAGHLVMTGRLLDDDPTLALAHARTAHDLAPRIVAVREALAVASYHGGDYRTALREARTVRRMSGDDSWLPMVADCERGLGRPDKALDLIGETDLSRLSDEIRAECLMVVSGARGDLGQRDAAVAVLDNDLLRSRRKSIWSARYRLAYSDALAAVGRKDEAQRWLALAAASDPTGDSGATARFAGADDVQLVDLMDAAPDGDPDGSVSD